MAIFIRRDFFFFKQKTAYEMLRSLVGSEMCIRDSLKAARAGIPLIISKAAPISTGVEAALKTGVTLICFANERQFAAYSHEAVSYTHLRAHETPEHLVCRLLLEKKKKKKKQNTTKQELHKKTKNTKTKKKQT